MGSIDNKAHILAMLCTLEDDEDVLNTVVDNYLTADASAAIKDTQSALNDMHGPADAPHAEIVAAAEEIEELGVFATLQGREFILNLEDPSEDGFLYNVIRVLKLLALTHFVHNGVEITVVPSEFDAVCALECVNE